MKRLALIFALLLAPAAFSQSAQFTCSNAQSITLTGTTAAGSLQLIAAPNLGRAANIYICSYTLQVTQTATPATFYLTSGTGTNCGTANTPLTAPATGTASSTPSIGAVFTSDAAIKVPANSATCLTFGGAMAASSVNIRFVTY